MKHELWLHPDGLESFILAGVKGNHARAMLPQGSILEWTVDANSHFEAMTQYYEYRQHGTYTTQYLELDQKPYRQESQNDVSKVIIGDKNIFAFEIPEFLDRVSSLVEVNIFLKGVNICLKDNLVYVDSFIFQLKNELNKLKNTYNFLKHESQFYGFGIEYIHYELSHNEQYIDVADELSFMRWGETVDDSRSFLIPALSGIYLTCEFLIDDPELNKEFGRIFAVEIQPYDLMKVIEKAILSLES